MGFWKTIFPFSAHVDRTSCIPLAPPYRSPSASAARLFERPSSLPLFPFVVLSLRFENLRAALFSSDLSPFRPFRPLPCSPENSVSYFTSGPLSPPLAAASRVTISRVTEATSFFYVFITPPTRSPPRAFLPCRAVPSDSNFAILTWTLGATDRFVFQPPIGWLTLSVRFFFSSDILRSTLSFLYEVRPPQFSPVRLHADRETHGVIAYQRPSFIRLPRTLLTVNKHLKGYLAKIVLPDFCVPSHMFLQFSHIFPSFAF